MFACKRTMYADVQDGRTSQHPRPDNNVILNIICFFLIV